MSFDDGMQFAAPVPARTEALFIVAATGKRGGMCFPGRKETADVAEAQALLEEVEARSAWLDLSDIHIRVWLPEHRLQDESVSLEAWQAMQPVAAGAASSEVGEEVVEQSGEASAASPEITVQKSDTVKVEAVCRLHGEAVSRRHVVYSGTSIKAAKAAFAEYRNNPTHGTSVVSLFHTREGCWIRSPRSHYDRHAEWLRDQRAGKFDAAYVRNWRADMEISAEARRRHAQTLRQFAPELKWNEQAGRYV